jgi:putative endonuclease
VVKYNHVLVAQLDRALDCGSKGRGFESRQAHFFKHMEGSHCASSAHPPLRRKWQIMFYFYVLRFTKNNKLYYGFTEDLRKRIRDHKSGNSNFTSRNGQFELIFYEAYINKNDAMEAERYFKSGHGREILREKLKHYLEKSDTNL